MVETFCLRGNAPAETVRPGLANGNARQRSPAPANAQVSVRQPVDNGYGDVTLQTVALTTLSGAFELGVTI